LTSTYRSNHPDPQSLVTSETTLFWFRRDLRIEDNAGLYYALRENKMVLPIFIFDTAILDGLDKEDARVQFILDSLNILNDELIKRGSSLLVLWGDPVEIFRSIHPNRVYTNRDYEPYAKTRDEKVAQILRAGNVPFSTYKDHVIFEKDEVVKKDGSPYTVFTPYSRQWKNRLTEFHIEEYPVEKYTGSFSKIGKLRLPDLEEIGFVRAGLRIPERKIPKAIISRYETTRNYPAISGTSRLGVHLRFGTVSIRQLVRLARESNETWLNELIWREFFSMILFHFPRVEKHAFKPAYDKITWRNDESEFAAWCEGKTGYPLVDAGMRELNATGFMHNRVRMVTASFLTKHLLIDWRWGEAYFASKLLDFDLASNNGNWQWAAGCGCDAAPYFRVFNPTLQLEKFDHQHEYIDGWIPELNTSAYPSPIVEHAFARVRTIAAYRKALQ
jgi:deoxyribodipyrimidine photo-lyase